MAVTHILLKLVEGDFSLPELDPDLAQQLRQILRAAEDGNLESIPEAISIVCDIWPYNHQTVGEVIDLLYGRQARRDAQQNAAVQSIEDTDTLLDESDGENTTDDNKG